MSVDYDAPRVTSEEEPNSGFEQLKTEKSGRREAIADVDETDLADNFELPGADLSNEELLIQVVPVQADEFTCMSCFLVRQRPQIVREKNGEKFCRDCEA